MLKKYPAYHIVNLDKLTYAGNLDNLKDVEANPNYTFIKVTYVMLRWYPVLLKEWMR